MAGALPASGHTPAFTYLTLNLLILIPCYTAPKANPRMVSPGEQTVRAWWQSRQRETVVRKGCGGCFGLILLIVLIVLASRGQQGMDQQQENRRGHLSEAPQMVGAPPETR